MAAVNIEDLADRTLVPHQAALQDRRDSGLPPSPSSSSEITLAAGQDKPAVKKPLHFATQCVFFEDDDAAQPKLSRDPYNATSMPIYQSATFKQDSANAEGDYDYSRSGNPTRSHLEKHLAKLCGATRSLVVSSGMSALDVILRLVKPGQGIVAGNDLYGGTNRLLNFLETQSIHTSHVDTTDVDAVINAIKPGITAMVMLETPTNPLIRIADIAAITKRVKDISSDILVVVDNTMMSPYLQRCFDLGVDIEYHSGTKYLSGHHDLMAGVIAVASEELAKRLYFIINAIGCGLPPFDCFLLMRGVKTLSLRLDRQQANAEKIALRLHALGLKVHYPTLPGHPGREIHLRQARGGGAVLSFETGCTEISEQVVDAVRLWSISVSFGCVNSLISMPCRMSHASIPAHVRKERALPEDLIRLCVGIEDVEDLWEDLEGALVKAGAAKLTKAALAVDPIETSL